MRKKYSRYNFFKHTYCEWQEIGMDFIKDRQPDYKSKAGSSYYFDEKGVARFSNHWGRAANCRWKLISTEKKNGIYCLAYATWDSFFANNEYEALYVIVFDKETNQVCFKHKELVQEKNAIARNAKDTNDRIKKINEILTTDGWFKYMESDSIDEVREFLINQLINSNNSFLDIKKSIN